MKLYHAAIVLPCLFACQSTNSIQEPFAPELMESPWKDDVEGDLQDELLKSLAALWWERGMERNPTWATYTGDPRYHGRLRDNSPEAEARDYLAITEFLSLSDEIDASSLTDSERITFELLREDWNVRIAQHESGVDLASWSINPRGGPQNDLQSLAADQPRSNETERRQFVQRWRAIPGYVDQHIANLRRGLENGRVAPYNSLRETIEQLDDLLATPLQESPLVKPALESGDGLGTDIRALTLLEIYPAFERYRDFLKNEALPNARSDDQPGVMHVAGGAAYYHAAIREHTSLDLSPNAIHEIGLSEVARIRAEMSQLGERVFGISDVAAIQERMRTDPALHFETAEEIRGVAEATLARANDASPDSFGILPKADCVVVPVPEHEAPYTTIAYYRGPAADGSRKGRYYVNTYKPETRPRYEAEVLALHEAVPGHHLQIAIAMELSELPIIRRHMESTAYVEGWALYTERLGDEMGLYSGDLDRLGILSFDAWRACRLVVDTGLHALGWTRDQAIEYMLENTLLARNNVENEVDRYIAWPGQALAYKLGQLEILQLRAEAKAALGPAFRLSEFHDRLLENGAVTLEVLRRHVQSWITESLKRESAAIESAAH